ncbi:hypothetical protein [Streptomyces sp. NPDC055036]
MANHDEAEAVRPLTPAWVGRHLELGERIVRTEAQHGGITAEVRRPTILARDGGTRDLVLRTFVDVQPARPSGARITGVVDWAATSRGPADLDVAHCSTHLALLHGPAWGPRFAEAYEEADGVLAATASERLYWRVRDGPAFSEEVELVSQPWREARRAELTTRAVEERLDAYVAALMATLA